MATGVANHAGGHVRPVSVVPLPDTTYVEGDGIYGGECGKWVKFVIRKSGSVTRGVIKLNLDYAEDAYFRSSVFINNNADERDLQRRAPSCQNNKLANNSVADALEHNFLWDVCVVDKQTFNVRYRVTRKGTFLLHVKLDGNPIPGSPFRIYISDATPYTAACRVYGRNIDTCYAVPYVPEIVEAIFPGSLGSAEGYGPEVDKDVYNNSPKGSVVSPAKQGSQFSFGRSDDKLDRVFIPVAEKTHVPASNVKGNKRGKDVSGILQVGYDPELGLGAPNQSPSSKTDDDPLYSKFGPFGTGVSEQYRKSSASNVGSAGQQSRPPIIHSSTTYDSSLLKGSSAGYNSNDTLKKDVSMQEPDSGEFQDKLSPKRRTRLLCGSDRGTLEDLKKRRQHTLSHLEQRTLLNEIEVHLADEHGNTVTHALPYVRAWGENYARVVATEYRSDGIVVVKYIVIVSREGLVPLKEAQSRGGDSVLPSSLKGGRVPCKINVEINGEPVFGSPFRPHICNVSDLEHYYESKLGTVESVVRRFTTLIQKHDFDACEDLYNSIKSPEAKDKFVNILLNKVSELEKENIYATSDIRLVESLKLQSLGRLLGLVHNQYKKMLTYKTSSIINSIRELNNFENVASDPSGGASDVTNELRSDNAKKFNNLGDVILNYRLIGDELRKLHRYELADKFDRINDQMCDQIDVGMWTSIINHKEKRVQKLREEVDSAAERLSTFKSSIDERYRNFTRKDLDDMKHLPGFAIEQAVQTEPTDLITSRLSHLVRRRCVPSSSRNSVDQLVEGYWRKCNNYDIQATVTKVLKSSIRLKNSISELFMYYSTTHMREGDRPMLGVSRASMELFVLEAMLNNYLTSNVKKLEWLFERFSIELPHKGDPSTPPPRAIPEHMWCAYLRELGYLNLLYTIAESGDREMMRDNQHPSRLVAFYHLCKEHLVPLYEMLFTTKPEFQKCLKFSNENVEKGSKSNSKASKKADAIPSEQYFRSRQDILNYFNVRALEHVLDAFDIDVLQGVFKHYSRLSMYGRQPVSRGWFNETATISAATFVVFARDFQIIPGHMDGERVHTIARSVAYRGQSGANKLGFRDFLNAISRTIARAVLAACLAKHDAYERDRTTFKDGLDNAPSCVQSKQSVKRDIEVMVQTIGICDAQFVRLTIDAIYGADAVEREITHNPVISAPWRQKRPAEGYLISLNESFRPVECVPNATAISQNGHRKAQLLETLYRRVSSGLDSLLRGLHILMWKGKHFKGCFIPSKWKWYHRHGYWATRKKLLKFDTYRRHRYHEVRGPGKRPPSKWEDDSFYKPLRDSIKFW
ncbi:uncharacterized protein BXIN_2955 [Babesia sp. Xinjiang]|uniref:uncharacterized protein n=1 Tax=Babesia sp. Xinjiang TaxID=462227 RepID=UPI000A23F764|nr:uncharacterized protein BXIN_2955 [Babesia sp. Xinjiang]ORM39414.1 hypothetical protein BXIN_2955 [Babesia sp. Xinjiang]